MRGCNFTTSKRYALFVKSTKFDNAGRMAPTIKPRQVGPRCPDVADQCLAIRLSKRGQGRIRCNFACRYRDSQFTETALVQFVESLRIGNPLTKLIPRFAPR